MLRAAAPRNPEWLLVRWGRKTCDLITASIGTPHTVFDAALNRASALFLKPKVGSDVALAGLFALLAGFVSASHTR
jgi:hypothetical protein